MKANGLTQRTAATDDDAADADEEEEEDAGCGCGYDCEQIRLLRADEAEGFNYDELRGDLIGWFWGVGGCGPEVGPEDVCTRAYTNLW